jgi:glyoxylase-like metal-dependent hydrolase (beta-lactamase superfamily II)
MSHQPARQKEWRRWLRWLALAAASGLGACSSAPPFRPTPLDCAATVQRPWQDLAPGVWVWPAPAEDITLQNRGHVSTQVLLLHGSQPTEATLIDPGPSLAHGQTVQRTAWCQLGVRIRHVINSHAHAENVLGNSAYADTTSISATHTTRASMAQRCPGCLTSITQNAGAAAMDGTQIALPRHTLQNGDTLAPALTGWQVQEHRHAHTESDLVLWNPELRVLVAPSLVYGQRLPELAQGSVQGWLTALDALAALQPRAWVGTQPSTQAPNSLEQTRQYLCDLSHLVWQAMDRGLSPNDAHALHLPAYQNWAGYARRHVFNVQRAWREWEPRWMAQDAPTCHARPTPRQPHTSAGN